jgi:hypothetical protein
MARSKTEPICSQGTIEARPSAGADARESDPSPLSEAFAHAITNPGARAQLIDENNLAGDWRPLSDADDPDAGSYLEHEPAPYLAKSGLRPVVMASGGEGRRHLFVRVEDPKSRLRLTEHARAAAASGRWKRGRRWCCHGRSTSAGASTSSPTRSATAGASASCAW